MMVERERDYMTELKLLKFRNPEAAKHRDMLVKGLESLNVPAATNAQKVMQLKKRVLEEIDSHDYYSELPLTHLVSQLLDNFDNYMLLRELQMNEYSEHVTELFKLGSDDAFKPDVYAEEMKKLIKMSKPKELAAYKETMMKHIQEPAKREMFLMYWTAFGGDTKVLEAREVKEDDVEPTPTG